MLTKMILFCAWLRLSAKLISSLCQSSSARCLCCLSLHVFFPIFFRRASLCCLSPLYMFSVYQWVVVLVYCNLMWDTKCLFVIYIWYYLNLMIHMVWLETHDTYDINWIKRYLWYYLNHSIHMILLKSHDTYDITWIKRYLWYYLNHSIQMILLKSHTIQMILLKSLDTYDIT